MTTQVEDCSRTIHSPLSRLSSYYQQLFGWPTTVDFDAGEVNLQLGDVVDALILRAGFAAEVDSFLVRHMFHAPIVVVPGVRNEWIFLTGPRTAMRPKTLADLVRIQVGWRRRNESIPLPEIDGPVEGLRWMRRPGPGMELPPWSTVVCAARRSSGLS